MSLGMEKRFFSNVSPLPHHFFAFTDGKNRLSDKIPRVIFGDFLRDLFIERRIDPCCPLGYEPFHKVHVK